MLDSIPSNLNPPSSAEYSGTTSYIINLDTSVGRYQYVKPKVYSLGYDVQRIRAVNGTALSKTYIDQVLDSSYEIFQHRKPNFGTIGCYLSHLNTWKEFLQSESEFALIFEDDVDFNPDSLKKILEVLRKEKSLWDIVSFEISHSGLPLTLKKTYNQKISIYLFEITHTGCYLINRKAARALIEKALPIKMPVDRYFTRSWEFNLKFIGIEPRLVHQKYGDSTISQTKSYRAKGRTYKDDIHAYRFKAQSYAIRFFYNLKIYVQQVLWN